MEDYVSIAKFAEMAGVSKQAVYQQIDGKLAQYVQTIDGKKKIAIKALLEVYGVNPKSEVKIENVIVNSQEIFELLQRQMDILHEQLREKDRQIATLHEIIEQQNGLALANRQSVMMKLDSRSQMMNQDSPIDLDDNEDRGDEIRETEFQIHDTTPESASPRQQEETVNLKAADVATKSAPEVSKQKPQQRNIRTQGYGQRPRKTQPSPKPPAKRWTPFWK